MVKTLNKQEISRLKKNLPKSWDKWTYRRVVKVYSKDAFYFTGQILKIKYFATFGCFDHKNRWVDYYDIGPEIQLNFWRRLWFTLTKWI